jgi:hypothetical protein
MRVCAHLVGSARVAASAAWRPPSIDVAEVPLWGWVTEHQIYAVPNGILAADVAGLVRDPGVDPLDHLASHPYSNALFHSGYSVLVVHGYSKH